MELTTVESSNIEAIGYDKNEEELRVLFKSGGLYRYLEVPEAVFQEFLDTESKGRFFYREIRGVYDYERIEDDDA